MVKLHIYCLPLVLAAVSGGNMSVLADRARELRVYGCRNTNTVPLRFVANVNLVVSDGSMQLSVLFCVL